MREYDIYVPFQAVNGSAGHWLEELLRNQFGEFSKSIGFHEGSWANLDFEYQGKVRTYSVYADEANARPFFKKLKQQTKELGHAGILIVEKEAPGPKGELAGERI